MIAFSIGFIISTVCFCRNPAGAGRVAQAARLGAIPGGRAHGGPGGAGGSGPIGAPAAPGEMPTPAGVAHFVGGEGGAGGSSDGGGGRGGRSGMDVAQTQRGLISETDPAYVFTRLTQEYIATHNGEAPNPLPEEWVNNRLAELGVNGGLKYSKRLHDVSRKPITFKNASELTRLAYTAPYTRHEQQQIHRPPGSRCPS